MADKENDDALEDVPSDEDGSNLASKGLSKPTLIKIALGLITLLIVAGGAYFFFMPSNKSTSVEAVSSSELASPSSTSESSEPENESLTSLEITSINKEQAAENAQLLKMREEAVALKEENLKMKERLSKLEAQQNTNVEVNEAEVNTSPLKEDNEITEAAPKPKIKTNQYSNLYTRDYTRVPEPQREPPPEPKWGNFDPLYRGK